MKAIPGLLFPAALSRVVSSYECSLASYWLCLPSEKSAIQYSGSPVIRLAVTHKSFDNGPVLLSQITLFVDLLTPEIRSRY